MASVKEYERPGKSPKKGWRIQVFLGRTDDGRQIIRKRYYYPQDHSQNVKPWSQEGKEMAYGALAEFKRDLGTATPDEAKTMPLREMFDRWIGARDNGVTWKPKTAEGYRMWADTTCSHIGEQTRIGEINAEHIEQMYNALRQKGPRGKPLKETSIIGCHTALSSAFTHATKRGWLTESPMASVERPKKPKTRKSAPTIDLVHKVLAEADQSPMWHTFMRFLIATGARRGEIIGLRFTDLQPIHDPDGDLVGGRLTLQRNVTYASKAVHIHTPKDDEPRTVILQPPEVHLWESWRQYVTARRIEYGLGMPDDGFLFTTGSDLETPIHPDSAKRWYARLRERVPELADVNMHLLRHFGTSQLANHPDLPVTAAQQQMGHSNLKTTQGYIHPDERMLHAASAVLSDAINQTPS